MKNILFYILFSSSCVFAQPYTVTIHHKYFTATYDTVRHYPIMVSWWLTRPMISCPSKLPRLKKFSPEPLLPSQTDVSFDYWHSGYDQGHNMPADNNECDAIGLKECFYYSNITPQAPHLNRGPWERLENLTKSEVIQYDSVKVWCGSFGTLGKINNLTIPKYCWKILHIKKLNTYNAYYFQNDSTAEPWTWTIDSTGYLNDTSIMNLVNRQLTGK